MRARVMPGPALRQRVVDADILVTGTPIWLGQPSSVAKRVLERMDAFLGETDDRGRMPSYGKVGLAVVVGNADGAHHTAAELFQALTVGARLLRTSSRVAADMARAAKLHVPDRLRLLLSAPCHEG
jgi:multimeric flavodoxin WrbA